MPETGSSEANLYRPINGIIKMAPTNCRVHAALILIPFLILLSMQIGLAAWILTRSEAKPYVTVVIDVNGTQRCVGPEQDGKYPCVTNNLYMASDEPIGPLTCRDDAFAQSPDALPDNCRGNAFKISGDGMGVVIPQEGLYRVYARVTWYDRVKHHTTLNLRIDQPRVVDCHGSHVCLQERDRRAHTWLTCQSHQPPAAANGTRDFAGCALDGVRRFKAGEIVGLQVAVGFRELSGHHKATHMYIYQL